MYGYKETPDSVRRRYSAYVNDGIWDLMMGLYMIFAALLMLADLMYLAGIWIIFIPPLAWSLKKAITVPRLTTKELETVRGGAAQRTKLSLLVGGTVLLIAGLLAFGSYFIEAPFGRFMLNFGLALLPVLLATFLAIVAYILGAMRWYAYVGLILLIAAAVAWLDLPLLHSLMALGGVIVIVGIIVMLRFLNSHPRLPQDQLPAW